MSRFIDPGILQEISNPKPLQIQSPAERMMTGLQLQKMMQDIQTGGMQQQDLQARAAESQAQAQQRALATQQDQQAGQITIDYFKTHPDAKPDDPGLTSALQAAGLTKHAEAHATFVSNQKKSASDTTKQDTENSAAAFKLSEQKKQLDDENAYVDDFFNQNPNIPKTPGAVAKAKSDFSRIGAKPEIVAPGSSVLDPITNQPLFTAPEKKDDAEKAFDDWVKDPTLSAKYPKNRPGFEKWKSDMGMNRSIVVQNAAANQASGNGLDLMAEQALNGQFTSRNAALLSKVYSRAADMAKERGMNSTQVLMAQNAAKANRQALDTLTNQSAQVEAFSQTAERNMQTLENAMKNVSDYGAPLLNTPLRSLQSRLGDPKVSAFYASLQPVQTEIAKVLNSSNASGMLTDSARHEMEVALGPGATPQQLKAALDIFRSDIKNRREVYQHQLEDLKGQTVVGGASAPQAAPSNNVSQPNAAPAGGVRVQTSDGKTGTIPAGQLPQFLKDNPGSKQIQ